MIIHAAFPAEEWALRETALDVERLAQTESVFSLGNGHLGLRGNLDEAEPYGLPGTYLNGFYEQRPLPYAEAGYGYPEDGQTVVNVTNGKVIRLMVDDEPLDLRHGEILHHERLLDFRAGVLSRTVEWRSPSGRSVRVRSTRMVSLVQRAVMGIEYNVEALDGPARVVIQSELIANEKTPSASLDPRVAAALDHPLEATEHHAEGTRAYLGHRTAVSGLRMAAYMDHVVAGPGDWDGGQEAFDDTARTTFIVNLVPGQPFQVVKMVGYGWSATRSVPAIRDQVEAAVIAAKRTGWTAMLEEQRRYLDRFWEQADVQIDGDVQIQQAVRFCLFHVLQSGARAEGRAIPAKGLTGPGYDGHAFWDTESFVLPVLTYTLPSAAADALVWRHSTLAQAKERAHQLGLGGAAFPWRTIGGEECSAYWPAGTAAFHVTADVADAVARYQLAAGSNDFAQRCGTELLVECARLWATLGYFDSDGEFRIDGVTGPDEYSAIADNNVYTNVMAKRNLLAAVRAVRQAGSDGARHHQVSEEELARWLLAGQHMRIPYDKNLEVHPQADGFTHHDVWDFESTAAANYPLLLHYPYFDLYRKQVVKQADLVFALFRAPDDFTYDEKQRDFEYYERLTVRDSSLSASIQAIMAAETGHLDLAYAYWGEAALIDLDDLEHNTRDGLHMAALAGSWLVAVCGFGGLRDSDGSLSFRPCLPPGLRSMAFNLLWRGSRLHVAIDAGTAVYTSSSDDSVDLLHYGDPVHLDAQSSRSLAIPKVAERPPPTQPPGREPPQRPRT